MKNKTILKKALVFMVMAALLAPLFLVKSAAAAQQKEYDINGFSISVPASWEHTEQEISLKDIAPQVGNGTFSMHLFMDGSEKGLFAVSMDTEKKMSIKKMKKEIKTAISNGDAAMMSGVKKIKFSTVDTNIGKGLKIQMTVTQNNKSQNVDVYITNKDTKMLVLVGAGVDCDAVLATLK